MKHLRKGEVISAAMLATCLGAGWMSSGCSLGSGGVLPPPLETRLAFNGTAEDHLAAALLYQQQAEREQAAAKKYEATAASIRPLEDTKGFRRSALIMAAQEHEQYAGEMRKLYAAHQIKAETMLGKRQPQ